MTADAHAEERARERAADNFAAVAILVALGVCGLALYARSVIPDVYPGGVEPILTTPGQLGPLILQGSGLFGWAGNVALLLSLVLALRRHATAFRWLALGWALHLVGTVDTYSKAFQTASPGEPKAVIYIIELATWVILPAAIATALFVTIAALRRLPRTRGDRRLAVGVAWALADVIALGSALALLHTEIASNRYYTPLRILQNQPSLTPRNVRLALDQLSRQLRHDQPSLPLADHAAALREEHRRLFRALEDDWTPPTDR